MEINVKDIATAKLHQLLLGGVAPRPIAFVSTVNKDGHPNLSPYSFFNIFSSNPPIAIFAPNRRVRDNSNKHTFFNAKEVPEVVINIVSYSMVQQMSLSSTEYAEGVNEFLKAGFSQEDSKTVRPPRVAEAPMALECKVREIIELGDQPGAGNLIVCEILHVHVKDEVLDQNGLVDPFKIDLVSRMGGNWYCRANGEAIFEVAKPLSSLGIGVDAIPEDIRFSKILTGNDLGMLGNVESLPNETDVNEYKLVELADLFVELEDNPALLEEKLHLMAKEFLAQGKVEEAWKTLLTFNN
ncbi:MAG: flavin reductase family protein [Luteibaculaceae bacterium]